MEKASPNEALALLKRQRKIYPADELRLIIDEATAQLAQTKSSTKVEAQQQRDEQGKGGNQETPPPAQADRQSRQTTTAADRKMSVYGSSNQDQEKEFLERLLASSALKTVGWAGWNKENHG
ncbi:hypothetical protein TrVE_jg1244 [Triparma verrucosa]|uniref:Uncharacterized protein n=1 Tax=Triparma verrucosa TaxID=1606542 RepID=A0A9W7BTH7_9STRA|nr:hypothetical protein TrVE_jg1244 [Triparma verrucosa]